MAPRDLLAGAFDTHVHASPDVVPRRLDFLEAAALAEASGMAGLVFKDVSACTVDRAYAANRAHPGVTSHGGLVLDGPVGGLNPPAVETALRRGAKVVWMPVVDARNMIERYETGGLHLPIPPRRSQADGLTVFDMSGGILREVKEIVRLIAESDAVLATGHLAARESIAVLRLARDMGVRRMIVTHPLSRMVAATLAEQTAMVEIGAMLEHCAGQSTSRLEGLPVSRVAESIDAVGFEHCIIAGDLGQTFNPPFVEGLRSFLAELEHQGVPRGVLASMVQSNPRRLLE